MEKKPANLIAAALRGSNFCVMPWINLSTETNGNCKICCVVMSNRYVSRPDGTPYRLHQDPIEEIWNSEYLREIRRKMLNREPVADCFYCNHQEESGLGSPRHYYNDEFMTEELAREVARSADQDGQVSSLPVSLEPRPGTACNLRCVSCWSMSSSRVEIERRKALSAPAQGLPDFLREEFRGEIALVESSDLKWANSDVYRENLRKCASRLKRLYFTGGEPTLIRSNREALEELVALGRTRMLVAMTTNLTRVDQGLLDLLDRFERVELTGSLDGIGRVNELLRFPSVWEEVSGTLLDLHVRYPRFGLSVMSVVQAANVFSFVDLVAWLGKFGLPDRPIGVIPTFLEGPDHLRVDILPPVLKNRALDSIERAMHEGRIARHHVRALEDLKAHLARENPRAPLLRRRFLEYFDFLDRIRATSWQEVLPGYRDEFERTLDQPG